MLRLREIFRSTGTDLVTEDDWIGAFWLPATLPAASQALAFSEGFWVARELLQDSTTWEQYDLDGTLTMRLKLPMGFQGMMGGREELLGVEHDLLKIESLARYTVAR